VSTRVAVIGAGSWGTTLANLLSKKGHDVVLWSFEKDVADAIETRHVNPVYLPDIQLSPALRATSSLADAVAGATVLVSVSPAQHVRKILSGIVADLSSETLVVSGQRASVSHILTNLLSNAIKYSPPGSIVSIAAGKHADHARLQEQDRGPGISPRDQERLFQRYVRLSPNPTQGESSTGLGLSLAKHKARAMGGDLWYEPRQGGGSTFTLELPLA